MIYINMTWFANSPVRKFGNFDVSHLKESLLNISETVWDQDYRNKSNRHFYETSTLWLRKLPSSHYGSKEEFHVFESIDFGDHTFDQSCHVFHKEFESKFNGVLVRSCIIRLLPGQYVEKHIDGDENLHRYCNRLILPIITNPQVIMTCEDTEDYPMSTHVLEENIAYDTNGYVPHKVVNNGTTTRYAFVLDFLDNQLSHPMTVKFYPTWTNEDWEKVSSQGQYKPMALELKYPGLNSSPAWRELYRTRKNSI